MADTKIAPNNQQVRFRDRPESTMKDDTEDRADQLHKKGLISEKARDAAKAKVKKKTPPKGDADEKIEGGDERDQSLKGSGKEKPVIPAKGANEPDPPKKGLALDDDGDHEYR